MASSPDTLLVASDLRVGYGRRVVLDNLSFSIRPGEALALLGPNGSGKSTLLKTLIRTLPPLAGEAWITGRPLRELGFRELAQIAAFVPQEELPPFDFTVREVVAMGRLAHSSGLWETVHDWEIVDNALRQADCLPLRDRLVTEISTGEKQRVLIARALAQKSNLLILDEPTSHLDIGHAGAVVSLVRSLVKSGYGVLIAMHDLTLAGAIADRYLVVLDGTLQEAPQDSEGLRRTLERSYGASLCVIEAGSNRRAIVPNLPAIEQ